MLLILLLILINNIYCTEIYTNGIYINTHLNNFLLQNNIIFHNVSTINTNMHVYINKLIFSDDYYIGKIKEYTLEIDKSKSIVNYKSYNYKHFIHLVKIIIDLKLLDDTNDDDLIISLVDYNDKGYNIYSYYIEGFKIYNQKYLFNFSFGKDKIKINFIRILLKKIK